MKKLTQEEKTNCTEKDIPNNGYDRYLRLRDEIKIGAETNQKSNDVMKDYGIEAATIIHEEGGWSGDTDVKIAHALFLKGYERIQIYQAINKLSPEMAGKNPMEMTYSQEITRNALLLESFRIPNSGLVSDKIGAEANQKSNVIKDYDIEATKIIDREKCWLGQNTDVTIAQALLLKGYERPQIHQAIKQLSPETAGKTPLEVTKYSHEITQKALTTEVKRQIYVLSKGNSLER